MQQLLIRLDDITPDMDWEKFERLAALFEQYQIHPIIGVVPDNRDETLHIQEPRADFWERMRSLQEQGWVIAQHGYTHVYVNKEPGLLKVNPFSEFAGLPYQEQYEKLKKGQEILKKQGIHTTMFMAPGHSFDRQTLRALKTLGFTSVTDGYCSRPYRRCGLIFLPCTLSSPRLPKRFDTLCLHSNSMGLAQFDALADFIGRHRKLIGNADAICFLERAGHTTEKPKGRMEACPCACHVRLCVPVRYITCLSEALPCACSVRAYVPFGWLEEHKNLFLRRVKRFAAENATVQAYFRRTDSDDAAEKKRKRLCGLPGLLLRLLFRRTY
ncbi:MAG: DUF2334 domain-containing protein [Lachnospiraceae bacterium]|nr:DUF2334 domain-containing protein [Lachnospiraceae bacterium]